MPASSTTRNRPALPTIVLAAPFALLAAWNVWSPYSYWFDELYSLAMANQSWPRMFDWIFRDVHPPLYQALLKLWTGALGDGEPQTRALSLVAALAAMAATIVGLRRRPLSFAAPAVLFVGSAWLFSYYAQETRGYALLLALSTVATLTALGRIGRDDDGRDRFSWYAILLALSLTHYFGLAYAGLLLLEDMTRHRSPRALGERIAAGAAMLAWPVIHAGAGSLRDKTGGNFWIESEGVGDTLRYVADAVISLPDSILGVRTDIEPWVLAALALLLAWSLVASRDPADRRRFARLLAVVAAFVAVVAVIDRHTPVSTERNFIVLLPPVALLFAFTVNTLWLANPQRLGRALIALAVCAVGVTGAKRSLDAMTDRWTPLQNWRGLAAVVEDAGLCEPHCWFIGGDWLAGLYGHYFRASMGTRPVDALRDLSDLVEAERIALPVIVAHDVSNQREFFLERYPDWRCYEPTQRWHNTVYLLTPDELALDVLQPCP